MVQNINYFLSPHKININYTNTNNQKCPFNFCLLLISRKTHFQSSRPTRQHHRQACNHSHTFAHSINITSSTIIIIMIRVYYHLYRRTLFTLFIKSASQQLRQSNLCHMQNHTSKSDWISRIKKRLYKQPTGNTINEIFRWLVHAPV